MGLETLSIDEHKAWTYREITSRGIDNLDIWSAQQEGRLKNYGFRENYATLEGWIIFLQRCYTSRTHLFRKFWIS